MDLVLLNLIVYLLKVIIVFLGCISGFLVMFFVMVALKYKDLF